MAKLIEPSHFFTAAMMRSGHTQRCSLRASSLGVEAQKREKGERACSDISGI